MSMSAAYPSSSPPCVRPSQQRGITLIELLIAVSVVGILTAVAMPSYSEYTRRAARSDAQLTLQAAATWLERRYAECNSYTFINAATNPPCTTALAAASLPDELKKSPSGGGTQRYTVSVSALDAQTYTVQAVPLDTTDKCGTMRILSTGAREATGVLGVNGCWRR
jgi:type IV pilus assembly protein PilE